MTEQQKASMPRVLIAYDGSDASKRALERVVRFISEAELALVTVVHPIYQDPRYTGYADPRDEEEQRKLLFAARDVLAAVGITATGFAPVGDLPTRFSRPPRRSTRS